MMIDDGFSDPQEYMDYLDRQLFRDMNDYYECRPYYDSDDYYNPDYEINDDFDDYELEY